MGQSARRRLAWLGWIFGAWTVASIVYGTHLYIFHNLRGGDTGFGLQLAEAFAHFYVWAALTPVVIWLGHRISFRRGRLVAPFVAHLVIGAGIGLVQVGIHTLVDQAILHGSFGVEPFGSRFSRFFTRTYYGNVILYLAIVGAVNVVTYYRERDARESRLEARLARAQLEALRMQIQPHFLFNTLHTISTLMREDVGAAEKMVTRLGDLLRMVLTKDEAQETSLRHELEFLQRYLDIERVRFQDRLRVSMEIGPDTLEARIPSFILQPLVENSIRHGISKQRGLGFVEIHSRRLDGRLRVEIRDNGAGLSSEASDSREGIGLRNTRAQLEQLYGHEHRLDVLDAAEGGVVAVMEIPFRSIDFEDDRGERAQIDPGPSIDRT